MRVQVHALGPGEVRCIVQDTWHEDRIILDAKFFNAFVQANIGFKEAHAVLFGVESLDLPDGDIDPLIQQLRIGVLGVHIGNYIICLHKPRVCLYADDFSVMIFPLSSDTTLWAFVFSQTSAPSSYSLRIPAAVSSWEVLLQMAG